MLEVRAVNKSYGKKQVLFDLSFCFEHGIYGLLGPNGAGKSTLLQIMTGNLSYNSGSVCYNGADIRKKSGKYWQKLGYVPQIQSMYEMFSAYQLLSYMSALKGIPRKKIKNEVMRVLDIVGLTGRMSGRLSTFSGGMKQRILIAQGLLGDPDVLILDEPTAGLDPKERIRIRNHISRISKEKTVILATHVVSDVDTIAKEILLLGNGRILDHGSMEELCGRMNGAVYECRGSSSHIERLEQYAVISNIQELPGGMCTVRVISGKEMPAADGWECREVSANLQEVYLAAFSDRGSGGSSYADAL